VFAEAMAMGLPIVALNNGGTPEVVADGETGLLSPPGDVETLASNILKLLEDRDLRQRLGASGVHRVADRFTVRRMARDAESVLVDGDA
jgi:glycosyltransferase involved in cell wall biosynthesis